MTNEQTFAMYVSYKNVIKPLQDNPDSVESKSIMELIEQRVLNVEANAQSFEVDYPVDQDDAVSFCEIWDDCYTDIQLIKIHYKWQQ